MIVLSMALLISAPGCVSDNAGQDAPISGDQGPFGAGQSLGAPGAAVMQADTARAAVIDDFAGVVSVMQEESRLPAFRGLALLRRDALSTGRESWSCLEINEGRFVIVEENANVLISTIADEAAQSTGLTEIFISGGKVWVGVTQPLRSDESFVVRTPTCSFSVRGTVFAVEFSDNETRLIVYEGNVALSAESVDGEPILDESGGTVVMDVSAGVARVAVENGVAAPAVREEYSEVDLAVFLRDGEEGPGGVYAALRNLFPHLVRGGVNVMYGEGSWSETTLLVHNGVEYPIHWNYALSFYAIQVEPGGADASGAYRGMAKVSALVDQTSLMAIMASRNPADYIMTNDAISTTLAFELIAGAVPGVTDSAGNAIPISPEGLGAEGRVFFEDMDSVSTAFDIDSGHIVDYDINIEQEGMRFTIYVPPESLAGGGSRPVHLNAFEQLDTQGNTRTTYFVGSEIIIGHIEAVMFTAPMPGSGVFTDSPVHHSMFEAVLNYGFPN